MCMKEACTNLSSNLDENYLAEGIASFIASKKYDEAVTVINTSKGNDVYREQQLGKHDKGTKRILVVDDEYDTNLTLKVVLEESNFKVASGSIT
jgi:hypoxanthine phosphoribosyltransferase